MCDICRKTFAYEKWFKRHQETHRYPSSPSSIKVPVIVHQPRSSVPPPLIPITTYDPMPALVPIIQQQKEPSD